MIIAKSTYSNDKEFRLVSTAGSQETKGADYKNKTTKPNQNIGCCWEGLVIRVELDQVLHVHDIFVYPHPYSNSQYCYPRQLQKCKRMAKDIVMFTNIISQLFRKRVPLMKCVWCMQRPACYMAAKCKQHDINHLLWYKSRRVITYTICIYQC